jgi:hypothetical protein
MCEDGTIITRIDKQWRHFNRDGVPIDGDSGICEQDRVSRR